MSAETDEPLVPEGAEVHGGWQMTPFGRTRVLKWRNLPPGLPDEDGEYAWLVRIVARQHPTGRIDTFEVEIGPAGIFPPGQALIFAGSIDYAISKIAELQQVYGEP
jgi:hypothetical protein